MQTEIQAIESGFRHPWAAITIFLFTFLLISFRRFKILPIGRPSGALTGAVLMVLFGVMSPEEAYSLVNWDTICLLFGMMVLAEHLRVAGLFRKFSIVLEVISSPFYLLVAISLMAALLSAILVNDTVCVMMTPFILELCRVRGLDPFPFLMALATNANIGSALTLTGNPQNMIIGNISKINYGKFIMLMILPVGVTFLINLILLWIYYRRRLITNCEKQSVLANEQTRHNDINYCQQISNVVQTIKNEPGKLSFAERRRRLLAWRRGVGIFSLGITCTGFFLGYSMAFSALAGAVLVITLNFREPRLLLAKLEWSLLLFFASLFVVIGGLRTSGLAAAGTEYAMKYLQGDKSQLVFSFAVVTLIGSNLLSNVPFVLLAANAVEQLVPRDLFWCLLAFVSTIAGNLTLFGSVANLIVAEEAKDVCEISFLDYAKFGIPSTIITIAVGTTLLYFLF